MSNMHRRGLSLLELVTVIAILAVLAGVVLPTLSGVNDQSTKTVTQHTLQQVREAIVNRYAVDMRGLVFIDTTTATPIYDVNLVTINKGLPVAHPSWLATDGSMTRNAFVPQLAFLYVNPEGNSPTAPAFSTSKPLAWRGPYLTSAGGKFPAAGDSMPNGQTASQNGFYGTGGSALYGLSIDSTPHDGWGSPIVIQWDATGVSTTSSSPPPANATAYVTLTLNTAVLVSAGADGVLNTSDDIRLKVN